jgi:hypothetical protein
MTFDAGEPGMGESEQQAEEAADRCGRERRATHRALAYWEQLCADRAMPTATPGGDAPPDDLRPSLFVVALRHPAENSVIEDAGGALDTLCGKPATGRRLSDAIPASLRDTFADLSRVIRNYGKPVLNSGTALTGDGRTVLYRSILLPIGEPDGTVTRYIGAIGCRQLPALA